MEIDHALVHDSALGATADGGLYKTGAGTLTVTGSNTYTGPTTVNNGTLQIGNLSAGGSLGTGSISINSTATLKLYRTDTYVMPNSISGSGTLDQEGYGGKATFTLPNPSFTGPITVVGGTLILTGAQGASGVDVSGGVNSGFGGITTINALTLSDGAILVPSDGTNLGTIAVNNSITNNGTATIAPGFLGAAAYSLGFHKVVSYTGACRSGLHPIGAIPYCR